MGMAAVREGGNGLGNEKISGDHMIGLEVVGILTGRA